MTDHNDIKAIEKRITETVSAITALVPAYASARQVIEYDSDRRKQLLAKYVSRADCTSMTAAESVARSRADYAEDLDNLAISLRSAYEVQAKWQALMARLDAARSLMAVTRTVLDRMPEAI